MVGIICSSNPVEKGIEEQMRWLKHRGEDTTHGIYSPSSSILDTIKFEYGVCHESGEHFIVQDEANLTLSDSLFRLSEDLVRKIASILRKSSINSLDADSLKEIQGLVLISVQDVGVILWRSLDGQKAIYYTQEPRTITIATEKKALLPRSNNVITALHPGHRLSIDWNGNLREEPIIEYSLQKWKGTQEIALKELEKSLRSSVQRLGSKKCGVLFSGGVDSSLLAHLLNMQGNEIRLFSASYDQSRDRLHAYRAAQSLELPITSINMTTEMIWALLPELIHAIETSNRMDVEIALPFYLATKRAREMHVDCMVSGQGPDEQFAGYARYVMQLENEGEEALEKQLRSDVSITHEVNIARDERAAAFAGLPIHFPYLDPTFTEQALTLPASWKINLGNEPRRKVIFRKLAKVMGLSSELCDAPKKATQFSSGASKALIKALSENVTAFQDMTRAEIEMRTQSVLELIQHVLRQPIESEVENDMGVDLIPVMQLKKKLIL